MTDRGWQRVNSTRPLPAVRPTTSKPSEELTPFHTKAGDTLWLCQADIDNLRLREYASEETGEIAYLAAMDIDGMGQPHYPPAHIEDLQQRLVVEAEIRTRCHASRKSARDSKPTRRYDKDTNEWSS
jgi:hypothetical protein